MSVQNPSFSQRCSELSDNFFTALKEEHDKSKARDTILGVICAIAIATLVNPVMGAAVGIYASVTVPITLITGNLGWDKSLAARVARAVISVPLGLAATFGALTALGISITFTPATICLISTFGAIEFLGSLMPSQ